MFLLPALYGEVHVPPAIWREVFEAESPRPMTAPAWVIRHAAPTSSRADFASDRLDPGETEAIQLALELRADLLLIDESVGRRTAQHLGIPITGVLGVLAAGKHRGLIKAAAPFITKLRHYGFWLSDGLVRQVLRDLGEST
jgi:predicted nucleic acid-binding protein